MFKLGNRKGILFAFLWIFSAASSATNNSESKQALIAGLTEVYEQQLSNVRRCSGQLQDELRLCSTLLRNDGNAPFALLPTDPKASIVLFHGLSDSPYYMRSIADHLYQQGFAVIAPLLPGHGRLIADADMQDPMLKQRWYQHVDDIMGLVHAYSDQVFIGGFSAGGTLATRYTLKHSEKVQGLLLFSGALQLSSSAESMASIWGMKKLALWLDGDYQTDGPNPYKYPKVASYSGLMLMDAIEDIRLMLASSELTTSINTPIFAAHSMADNITPYAGVEKLMMAIPGDHTQFKIDAEFDVCHGDLVFNSVQVLTMKFDKSKVNQSERCAVPKANPLHSAMLSVLGFFVEEHK